MLGDSLLSARYDFHSDRARTKALNRSGGNDQNRISSVLRNAGAAYHAVMASCDDYAETAVKTLVRKLQPLFVIGA